MIQKRKKFSKHRKETFQNTENGLFPSAETAVTGLLICQKYKNIKSPLQQKPLIG
jgi:hypothetical protein